MFRQYTKPWHPSPFTTFTPKILRTIKRTLAIVQNRYLKNPVLARHSRESVTSFTFWKSPLPLLIEVNVSPIDRQKFPLRSVAQNHSRPTPRQISIAIPCHSPALLSCKKPWKWVAQYTIYYRALWPRLMFELYPLHKLFALKSVACCSELP